MRHLIHFLPKLVWIAILSLTNSLSAQVFVDLSATGANDGTSWANAYTDLQEAIDNSDNATIWVAQGIYYPSSCNACSTANREQAFELKNNITLLGGFNGTESASRDRDIEANPTILSGDIGTRGDSTDNSYHVVVANNNQLTAQLDGFTIEHGNADAPGFDRGGGLYINGSFNNSSSPSIRKCTFRNNYASGGGAIGIDATAGGACRPSITGCRFENNTASLATTSFGGAILGVGSQGANISPQISDCQFINNYSGHHGGALAFSLSGDQSRMGAFIARCTFIGNEANERGGAIWSRMTTNAVSSWILGNSLFENNHAGAEGGAIYNRISFDSQGDDQILTSVFRKNSTDKSGGAVYLRGSQGANSEVDVVHCTFDQNQSADKGGAVYKDADEFAPGSLDTRILNCTFWQNEAMNSGGDVYLEQGGGQLGFELHNSILWEGSDPGIGSSNASGRVSHCILQHPLPDDLIDGGNNFSEDPVFADAAAGDFHPLRCSPAIDAGDNDALPLTFNADRDGKPRISNGTIDLGIYESQRIYVNSSATTNGNGQSWATPYNRLDQGVNNATAGDEVWVAAGTYKPSVSGNRALSFNIQSGAEVYGGFAGTENSLSERNISANPTILSGEIGTASSTDNSFRVVTIGDAVKKTSLDGFIIEAANNDLVGNGSGGGLFLDAREGRSCQPTIRHCVFRNNRATGGGAVGMEANQGGKLAPTFEQCQFENNSSTDAGGGLFYDGSSSTEASIQLTSCQFTSNQSNQHGGAIALRSINNDTELHTYLDSCTFEENNTQGQGGALWLQDSDNAKSQVRLRSCQFSENQSDQQGGALYLHDNTGASSNDTLLNCLFTKNASITNGGALFLGGTQQGNNQTILINCVFDRNEAGQQGGGLYSDADENGGGNVQTRVINNSFSRNFSNGQGGGIYIENGNGSSDINIANSILWDNNAASGAAELATDAASGNITHSIIRGGIPSNVSDDGGNLFVDPQFIDPANGNLKTSGCSPAIDKGSDDLLPIDISDIDNDIDKVERIDIDLEGNTRIFQLAVDMGAFEWNGNPTPLEVSSTQTNVSCNSACDGVANLLTNGGVPGYTFLWSTGETTASISDLCAGTYTVTITDANKCLLTESITISENAVLSSSISAGMTLCANEQANISLTANGGDGNYTYNWDNGLGNAANHSVSPSNTTTYSVTITDGRGCSDQQSVTILVNALPEPLASETLNLCSGSNIDLDAGPFEDYAWSTGAGTQTINIDRAGTYAVTVTDVNNCQGTDSVKVRQVANPTPVLEGSKTFCVGGSTTFDPGSSFSAYEWSNGSLNQTLTVFATGTYAVTVTDANGCSGSAQVFAEANGMLESSIEGILSICQGATTDLEATEYDSYLWSTGETTRVINVGSGGTYSVTVTDDSGCTGVSSVDVLDNTSPNLNITGDTSYCAGSTTTLSVFPTFSEYLWSNGSGAQSIDVGSAGNYEVMVTDANGCTAMSQVVITETAIPQASITGTDSICEGDFTFLMGGSFERYQWSTGDSTQMISVREDGLYALTVTDDNGCTGSEEFELTVNANPIPQINGLPNYCPGGSTVLGGGSFSSWAWSTGANSRMINVSTAGSYGLTVTDANGCTGEASLNVFEINTLNPVIEGTTS
ncbi:MAG: choice-of-anchor Q domain-containing protein, partial [Bacteroidota bacterium]